MHLKATTIGAALVTLAVPVVMGYSPQPNPLTSRTTFLSKASTFVATSSLLLPRVAFAESSDFITTDSGMKYKVTQVGTGAVPSQGSMVKAHYTGWLDDFDSPKKFDSSRDRGKPFSFKVGAGQVIKGWDESFSSMKVGERRQIILPPNLAYGERGAGGVIPGGATLYFDVELLAIV
ncbi:hypothetical protein TrCOL_g13731 [Triparma columacea]|uniref:peptidylprolyl isomerase n=1 Tax=Triparma columacea TaxID=722753 RepID=A0A9W7FZH7_9STRA|nr:hypothetical protein TrCOL_g13731 [Triparma columacea]